MNDFWTRYRDHVSKWYFEPDFEAIRILTANIYAHTHLSDPPAWLFLVGPPGSGKTRLGINPFATIPRSVVLSDVSAAGFWSTDRSRRTPINTGLLVDAGNPGNAIWLFKDFTTLLAKDPKQFTEIMSRLREIHDGTFSRAVSQVQRVPWRGKITCIAASPGAIEARLAAERDFGERFFLLRWRTHPDARQAMIYSRQQLGKQDEILAESQEILHSLISQKPTIDPDTVQLPTHIHSQIDDLLWLTAKVSRTGIRNSKHQLIEVGETAYPTRMAQGIETLMRGHALMFNRPTSTSEEISLVRRLALDTIPQRRALILQAIPFGDDVTTFTELLQRTRIPKTALKEHLEVLVHTESLIDQDGIYSWSPELQELAKSSGILEEPDFQKYTDPSVISNHVRGESCLQ